RGLEGRAVEAPGWPDLSARERDAVQTRVTKGPQGGGTRAPVPRSHRRTRQSHVASSGRAELSELTPIQNVPGAWRLVGTLCLVPGGLPGTCLKVPYLTSFPMPA